MSEQVHAVLDRIEDEQWAVLLIGEKENEMVTPISKLPANSVEGDHFKVTITNKEISSIVKDEGSTIETKKRISDKMKLLKKKTTSKYKSEK